VVELRGMGLAPVFEMGGKQGNVVTKSNIPSVHKGWRAVAVDGRRMAPAELSRALAGARQRPGRYTVTFRIEAEDKDAEEADPAPTDAAAGRARRELAEVGEEAEDEAGRDLAEEAARRAAEEEAARRAAEEKEAARRAAEEEEAARRAAEEAARAQAVRRLEERSGLPPRGETPDPQQALLQALARAGSKAAPEEKKSGPCDKCDGPHHEDDCPYFKSKRDEHKDAWDSYGRRDKDASKSQGTVIVTSARLVPQPGDGSCLFHSLAHGLGGGLRAEELRAQIADYIAANPEAVVGGNPLKDWVLWDSGLDVQAYARTMRTGSRWGGALELAVCAQVRQASVHVYEARAGGFARISTFGTGRRAVNVNYGGRVHYDALEL